MFERGRQALLRDLAARETRLGRFKPCTIFLVGSTRYDRQRAIWQRPLQESLPR
jgi:hypothetical protein